jgi:hypothetical protein
MRRWCNCLKCREYTSLRQTVERIRDLESGDEYQVEERLSAQFTAFNVDTGKCKFFFWKDYNVEWEKVDE